MRIFRSSSLMAFSSGFLLVLGCGGGGGGADNLTAPVTPPSQPPAVVKVPTTVSFTAGDGQTVRKGTVVPVAPSVIVKDQTGAVMGGVSVTFSVSGGGSLATQSAVTAADGIAAPGVWTLGPAAGPNVLTASVSGGANPTAGITATARNPLWTIMVYMAADNSLASSGIDDLDEMEAATANPEVQVVVEAEFGSSALSQEGCSSACFNRPNFNTFRYVLAGQGAKVPGPNGTVTDIGNRNMTDPLQLREFINYAKQTVPAEHYITVLWNHGGGYTGLLTDEGSAPGVQMSVADLPSGFSGVGTIDIVAFDMCLMGGYETLTKVNGLASYVVFSEETEPGSGYAYDRFLSGLSASPTITPKNLAVLIADAYDASYSGLRYTTTVSAYDLTGFAAFEGSLNTLATALKANMATLNSGMIAAAAGAQSFEMQPLKDFGNLMDSLRVQLTDPTIRSAIDAAKSAAISFRLQQHVRTGTGQGQRNVNRATGLNILMPSGIGADRLPSSGTGSLAAYQAIVGTKPWGQFIASWLVNRPALGYTDLGASRFETYLVWDTAAVTKKADLDFFVLEPDGNLYGPAIGTISPSGHFTADSYTPPPTYFEGEQFLRFVQTGTHKFYALLWTDPSKMGPVYDVVYRNNPAATFSHLYASPFPRLTTTIRFVDDPNPTFAKIDNNQYTDIRAVAVLTVAPNASPNVLTSVQSTPLVGTRMSINLADAERGPHLTSAQIRAVRGLMIHRPRQLRPSDALKASHLPSPQGDRQ